MALFICARRLCRSACCDTRAASLKRASAVVSVAWTASSYSVGDGSVSSSRRWSPPGNTLRLILCHRVSRTPRSWARCSAVTTSPRWTRPVQLASDGSEVVLQGLDPVPQGLLADLQVLASDAKALNLRRQWSDQGHQGIDTPGAKRRRFPRQFGLCVRGLAGQLSRLRLQVALGLEGLERLQHRRGHLLRAQFRQLAPQFVQFLCGGRRLPGGRPSFGTECGTLGGQALHPGAQGHRRDQRARIPRGVGTNRRQEHARSPSRLFHLAPGARGPFPGAPEGFEVVVEGLDGPGLL